jgi:hypothetical protein
VRTNRSVVIIALSLAATEFRFERGLYRSVGDFQLLVTHHVITARGVFVVASRSNAMHGHEVTDISLRFLT